MAKDKKQTVAVEETAAVIQENKAVAEVAVVEEGILEAELIAPGTFISEAGNEYEFTTGAFVFKGKKYDVADALANAPEVLEELVKLNSFILKQK